MKRFPRQFKSLSKGSAVSLCVGALAVLVQSSAQCKDLVPEFTSRVWIENDKQIAAVSMNGKDLITFRSHEEDSDDAAEEAEELAVDLQELVSEKNFDVTQLLPGRDGDKAIIRIGGNNVISFDPLSGNKKDDKDSDEARLDASTKLVNGIRLAMGASVLPSGFPDVASVSSSELKGHGFSGQASWYGPRFHGRKTSDGHRFDMDKLTAAHRSLPFGTKLLVMNRKTGTSCVVEVNDRGPFIDGRVLDLSRGAARQLNMIGTGVAMVDCLIIGGGN